MKVIRLRYWASARSAAGVSEDDVEADAPMSLAALVDEAVRRHPGTRLEAVLGVCSVLVGDRPVSAVEPEQVQVAPGEVVEFLPPFAGG